MAKGLPIKERERTLKILNVIVASVLITLALLLGACGDVASSERTTLKVETKQTYSKDDATRVFNEIMDKSCLKVKDFKSGHVFEVGCETLRKEFNCHFWGSYSSCDLSILPDKDNLKYTSDKITFWCDGRINPIDISIWKLALAEKKFSLVPMVDKPTA